MYPPTLAYLFAGFVSCLFQRTHILGRYILCFCFQRPLEATEYGQASPDSPVQSLEAPRSSEGEMMFPCQNLTQETTVFRLPMW